MSNQKRIFITFIILTIIWILGFYMYNTYKNIEINNSNYTATRIRIHSSRTNCGKSPRR